MIISHEHRFIFLKTKKTAGTSLELALRSFCGEDDIITPITEDRNGETRTEPRNWREGARWTSARPIYKRKIFRIFRQALSDVGFYAHMPAAEARCQLNNDKIWNSYFKFAFDRNPWDRQVSQYHYRFRRYGHKKPDFKDFLQNDRRARMNNYQIYSIDGDVCLDFVGRFESLHEDFDAALSQIGLKLKEPLPRAKTGIRPSGKPYQQYYDDRTRDLVANWYAPEIALLNYSF